MNTEQTKSDQTFTVLVTGEANAEVTPDKVHIGCSIQVHEKDRETALEKALTIRSMLIDKLKERHSDCERNATAVTLQKRVRYSIGNKQVADGYLAYAQVTVKAKASEAKELLATMAIAEEVNVHTPQFVISRALHDQTQMELIKKAVSHAKLQAETMADACSAKLSHIVSIGEEHSESYVHTDYAMRAHRQSSRGRLMSSASVEPFMEESAEAEMEELIGELKPVPVEQSRQVKIRYELVN